MLMKKLDKWLIFQLILFFIILFVSPITPIGFLVAARIAALGFLIFGLIIVIVAFFQLGKSFTPFVVPTETGALVTTGLYGIVRHPMYLGVMLLAIGWSLYWASLIGLFLTIILFIVLNQKANKEERLLTKKYPAYKAYQARVKKMIPFIY